MERSKKYGRSKRKGAQPGNKNSSGGPPGNKKAENSVSSANICLRRPFLLSRRCRQIRWMSSGIRSRLLMAAIIRAQQIMYVRDRDDKTIEKIEHKDGNIIGERWEYSTPGTSRENSYRPRPGHSRSFAVWLNSMMSCCTNAGILQVMNRKPV